MVADALPVHAGGLIVYRAVHMASSYLTSAAGRPSLIHEVLEPSLTTFTDPTLNQPLLSGVRIKGHSRVSLSFPEYLHQRVWDAPLIQATYNSLLEGASN